MTQWPSYTGPPIQPCCGKRHQLPFVHVGEQTCINCHAIQPVRNFGYKALICKSCCQEMGITDSSRTRFGLEEMQR